MTALEKLYVEKTPHFDSSFFNGSLTGVAVAVRRWTSDFAPLEKEDVILHVVVNVDGQRVYDSRTLLPSGKELSWYQRRGMQAFDEAVKTYPHAVDQSA